MKISYNSLKKYLNFNLSPDAIGKILTDIGLEVESIEEYESIKGGMEGLIIGLVKTCEKHPDADKLSITTVDTGTGELLPIVCGAPNVRAGQKVVVATIGTKLYIDNKELVIKKGKIRGAESHGMICAEDEIGLGISHEGIMVLPENTGIGMPAKDYFKIEKDFVFEIGLTPNHADAASHFGTARDLFAYFQYHDIPSKLIKPSVELFKADTQNLQIDIDIQNHEACARYAGVTLTNIEIKDSPDWLKNHLRALGLSPINNVVDITNFVLHETGQPLHAFDADKISGRKVIIKNLPAQTPFVTLDKTERKLSENDLMICNSQGGMCIAGVFGGADSGISADTKNIFLESAYFNPVSVRKTSKLHTLQTDASYRFERGVDPENIVFALKRAAMLIKEIAGGQISSDITDIYIKPINRAEIEITFEYINRLIGNEISKDKVIKILKALEIDILKQDSEKLLLKIPTYKVDVKRPADVVEEILRIFGYNNVEMTSNVRSTLSYAPKPDGNKLRNQISEMLSSVGFSEAMSNSLTKISYYETGDEFSLEKTVKIMNPLSSDLGGMRQTLIFGALEAVIRNLNYKTADIKTYEFGNIYQLAANKINLLEKYHEEQRLAITISGKKQEPNWITKNETTGFYYLKTTVENILKRLHFTIDKLSCVDTDSNVYQYGLKYQINGKTIAEFGLLNHRLTSRFDIKQEVFFADLHWDTIVLNLPPKEAYQELPKFPKVRRDLALLVDKNIKFEQIKSIAFKTERKLLKEVSVFDVFEDKKLGENKKSYAVSFILWDDTKTLNDQQIDKIMERLTNTFKSELGAELR
jgi:phenylalanyl-tRNA synthetase beta chain